LDGGFGNDNLLGSQGNDVLLGGDNDDLIDGQRGNDAAFLGAGNDTFLWDPGDGNDIIEGQAGLDRLLFNGSNVAENIELSANGSRLRSSATWPRWSWIAMTWSGCSFNALGGGDIMLLKDLSATDVIAVHLALSGTIGGTTGDAQPDAIIVQGTASDNTVLVTNSAGEVGVVGLSAAVTITAAKPPRPAHAQPAGRGRRAGRLQPRRRAHRPDRRWWRGL